MNELLKEAVRERVALGHSRSAIVAELEAAGYEKTVAEAVYGEITGGEEKTPAQTTPGTPSSEDSNPSPEFERIENSLQAETHTEPYSYGQVLGKQKSQLPVLLGIVLFVVLIGGGVAYGFMSGGLSLSGMFDSAPYETEAEMVAGLVQGGSELTAYGFNTDYEIVIEAREADTPTVSESLIPPAELDTLAEAFSYAPQEGHAKMSASGLLDVRDKERPEFDVSLQLNVLAEPFILNAAGSMRVVDGTLYGRVDKLPANFRMFLEGIPEEQWIILKAERVLDSRPDAPSVDSNVSLQDGAQLLPFAAQPYVARVLETFALLEQTVAERFTAGRQQVASGIAALGLDTSLSAEERQMLKRSAELLQQYPPITFIGEPEKVELNGETVHRYEFDIDYDNARRYFLSVIKEAEAITGETLPYTESELDELLPARAYVAEFNRLTNLTVSFRADGSLAGGALTGLLAFDHPEIPTQFRFDLSFSYTRQNDALDITAPTEVYPQTLEQIMEQRMREMLLGECGGDPVCESLAEARAAGSDASVKQSLSNIRVQAEFNYNENEFSYSDVCEDPSIQQLLTSIVQNNHVPQSIVAVERDSTSGPEKLTCNDRDEGYAITIPLVSDTSTLWCIDSTGFVGDAPANALSRGDDVSCN